MFFLREHLSSPRIFDGSVLLIFLVFCVVLLCVLGSEFRVVMYVTISE